MRLIVLMLCIIPILALAGCSHLTVTEPDPHERKARMEAEEADPDGLGLDKAGASYYLEDLQKYIDAIEPYHAPGWQVIREMYAKE